MAAVVECPDDTLLAEFLSDGLAAARRDDIERHVDLCSPCRRTLSALVAETGAGPIDRLASSSEEPSPGTQVGRYLLLEPIGMGGMGVVFAAQDPDLARKVAVKLLRPRVEGDGSALDARRRLLHEGQAMARLSHPHIVAVYDVGTFGDHVFLSMEHIDGWSLSEWLGERRRSWREILAIFLQAGAGLAAAHAAGVVHCDFKPDNVLVSREGRAAVTDFGLARPTDALAAPQVIAGTPAYMAPEQRAGGRADVRSDQHSFCVALYEALYGLHPFAGADYRELSRNAAASRVGAAPPGAEVPAWLRDVLLRGLAASPADRYLSMDALLRALRADPAARRRRVLLVASLAASFALLSAAAAYGLLHGGSSPAPCRGASDRLSGVWDPAAREAVGRSFRATGLPYAADTLVRVEAGLDAYAASWTAARTQACEATRVRGEQSEALLDRRMACLDEHLAETGALVRLFTAGPNPGVLEHAVQAVERLASIDDCADGRALMATASPPRDPAAQAQIDQVRRELQEAKAHKAASQYRAALASAQRAAEAVRRIDYAPVRAQALHELGVLQDATGDARAAEATLFEAARAASEAGDDTLVAKSWSYLVWVVGYRQARLADGRLLALVADAAVARAGSDADLRGQLLIRIATLDEEEGKYEEALAGYRQALALRRAALGPDHAGLAVDLAAIGDVLESLARYDEARATLEQAVALVEGKLGPDHPAVATPLNSLGVVLLAQGKHEEAAGPLMRSLAIRERVYGPDHPPVAGTLNNLAGVREAQGDFAEARRLYARALAIREKALGPEHPQVALILVNSGEMAIHEGEYVDARAQLERALAIREKVLGRDHPDVGGPLVNLGIALARQGHRAEAARAVERALALWEKALGSKHPRLAAALTALAEVRLGQGRAREALAAAERALDLRTSAQGPATELAETRFVLAQALWSLGRERPRALELARAARDALPGGRTADRRRAQVDTWLASRAK